MKAKRIIGLSLALMLCAGALLGAGAAEGDGLRRLWDIPFYATEEEIVAAVKERTGVTLARAPYAGYGGQIILESPAGAEISLFGRFEGVRLEFFVSPEGMADAAPWTNAFDSPAAALYTMRFPLEPILMYADAAPAIDPEFAAIERRKGYQAAFAELTDILVDRYGISDAVYVAMEPEGSDGKYGLYSADYRTIEGYRDALIGHEGGLGCIAVWSNVIAVYDETWDGGSVAGATCLVAWSGARPEWVVDGDASELIRAGQGEPVVIDF